MKRNSRRGVVACAGIVLAVLVVSCGPAGPEPDAMPTSATTANDESTGGDVPTTADASTTNAASTSAGSTEESTGAAMADSSTGEAWTWNENSYSALRCEQGELLLFMEIYLQTDVDHECAPPPDIDLDNLVVVGIAPWDGEAGTFEVDGETVRVAWLLTTEPVTGTVTLEVERPFVPAEISIDIAVGSDALAGSVGLAACFTGGPPEPCKRR